MRDTDSGLVDMTCASLSLCPRHGQRIVRWSSELQRNVLVNVGREDVRHKHRNLA